MAQRASTQAATAVEAPDAPSAETPPTIDLAGRSWVIPMLAGRQNRVVVPALLDVVPKIIHAREQGGGDLVQLGRFLDTETYDKLLDLTFAAITRGDPSLTREAFDDMPIDTLDLIGAVTTIARQAGLYKAPRAAE